MDRQTLLAKLKDLSIKRDDSDILEISKFIDNSNIWFFRISCESMMIITLFVRILNFGKMEMLS